MPSHVTTRESAGSAKSDPDREEAQTAGDTDSGADRDPEGSARLSDEDMLAAVDDAFAGNADEDEAEEGDEPEKPATKTKAKKAAKSTEDDAAADDAEDDDATDEEGDDAEEADDDAEDSTEDEDAEEDGDEPEAETDEDPEALTETERKNVSKTVQKKVDRLLKERTALRAPADFGKAVAEKAAQAGFDRDGFDRFLALGATLNQEAPEVAAPKVAAIAINMLAGENAQNLGKPERAAILRRLADQISPAPKPAAAAPKPKFLIMDADLARQVEDGALKAEEAELIAIRRYEAANPPKREEVPPPAEEVPPAAKKPAAPVRPWTQATYDAGSRAAEREWAALEKKYGKPVFDKIADEVLAGVKKQSGFTHPNGYVELLRTQVRLALSRRKGITKTPPQKVLSGNRGGEKKARTDWDDVIEEVVR